MDAGQHWDGLMRVGEQDIYYVQGEWEVLKLLQWQWKQNKLNSSCTQWTILLI